MASKVLVPAAPFTKLQVKKSPPADSSGGFIIGTDATARVAHLEHSVRFLQEQHRLMLSGLHAEIEALRERNRDLQFQLIFNKESTSKPPTTPAQEEITESSEEAQLKREVSRLEREAAAARGEARAAEGRALQLQKLVDAQTEKLRELEVKPCPRCLEGSGSEAGSAETRAELRARLADAERLVRRLRGDAERQRREVQLPQPLQPCARATAAGVTNLLFDGAAASHAHLQCMKNSLHASLRASGLDGGYGYQNNYHFPPVHAPDFWREPIREDYSIMGRGRSTRRPLTLPELSATGQQIPRSTVYANHHTRPRPNGYENKIKTSHGINGETINSMSPADASAGTWLGTKGIKTDSQNIETSGSSYPEVKFVVTKIIPHNEVQTTQTTEGVMRARPSRRHHHRKHTTEQT